MHSVFMLQLLADDFEELDVIKAGHIGAAAGLKTVRTGEMQGCLQAAGRACRVCNDVALPDGATAPCFLLLLLSTDDSC